MSVSLVVLRFEIADELGCLPESICFPSYEDNKHTMTEKGREGAERPSGWLRISDSSFDLLQHLCDILCVL